MSGVDRRPVRRGSPQAEQRSRIAPLIKNCASHQIVSYSDDDCGKQRLRGGQLSRPLKLNEKWLGCWKRPPLLKMGRRLMGPTTQPWPWQPGSDLLDELEVCRTGRLARRPVNAPANSSGGTPVKTGNAHSVHLWGDINVVPQAEARKG